MAEKLGKILYAEDDEILRTVSSMHLKKMFPDYEIECFENGTSLEKKLNNGIGNARLVLTDNNMPGITGREIIINYAQRHEFRNLPFILFYGGDEKIGKELVERYGAFAYIPKLGGIKNLVKKVREALNYADFRESSR